MDKQNDQILIKILLLAFFFLLVYSWFSFHVYNDLIAGGTGALLTFWALVSFLLKYQKKDEQDRFRDILSRWLSGLLSYRIIVVLYILFFITGSFISSVHVVTGNVQKNLPVTICAGKDTTHFTLSPSAPEVKYTVFASPFGKTFALKAEGYQKTEMQVYPWIGKRILVERDLPVSPTLIIRIPEPYFMFLSRAALKVIINNRVSKTIKMKKHATVLIGSTSDYPPKYCDRWLNELRGKYEDTKSVYSYLNQWCNDTLFIPVNLGVYDSIRIELLSGTGELLAAGSGVAGAKIMKELRLKSVKE
jgi:hypothetical protein